MRAHHSPALRWSNSASVIPSTVQPLGGLMLQGEGEGEGSVPFPPFLEEALALALILAFA